MSEPRDNEPQDHFSKQANQYRHFRPHYPSSLFGFLAEQSPQQQLAIDIAAGTGQATGNLARHFEQVLAMDMSYAQLRQANRSPETLFCQGISEQLPIADQSADLITVAQALHWFDHPRFYQEVRRVLKPGGIIAAWTYKLLNIAPDIDQIVSHLHRDIVGSYWPAERQLVENGYRDIPFPFETVNKPDFTMSAQWQLQHLIGYLSTWSAVQRYKDEHQQDPVKIILPQLEQCWGDTAGYRQVSWPMPMLLGRV